MFGERRKKKRGILNIFTTRTAVMPTFIFGIYIYATLKSKDR